MFGRIRQDKAAPAPAPEPPSPRIQNRNRRSPASIQQMQSIAARPDYGRLGFSRDFANGAPVVLIDSTALDADAIGTGDYATAADGRRIHVTYAVIEADRLVPSNDVDGLPVADWDNPKPTQAKVIAGNGRVAGLKAAWRNGTADGYAAELEADQLHSISRRYIESLDRPVLVRIMKQADVTQDIGDVSNTVGNLELSPVERAQNDAERINLEALEFGPDGDISTNVVRRFVQAMPKSEQGGLIDANGLTRQAFDRIEAAIFAKAYSSPELIRLMAQARDPEARNVISALTQVAPQMARLADLGEYDIRELVTEAAQLAVNARRMGITLQRAAQQSDIQADPDTAYFLRLFARHVRSVAPVVDKLRELAETAYSEATKDGADMFGAVERMSRGDILRRWEGGDGTDEGSAQGLEDGPRGGAPGGMGRGPEAGGGGRGGPPEAQGPAAAAPGGQAATGQAAQGLIRDPAALPEGVRLRVQGAVERLGELRDELQRALDGRGHGYTFALTLIEKLPAIRAAREPLNEFRRHAERNGFDAEAVIEALGGDLNLEPFVVNDKPVQASMPVAERLLCMPCGEAKLGRAATAGELYQGPMWQTLRTHQPAGGMPNMLVLSAKYGMVDQGAPLEPYDQRMTPERLAELRRDMADNVASLERSLKGKSINEVLIVGAADYRAVMAEAVADFMARGLIRPGAVINAIEGQIGEQRRALGEWLRGLPAAPGPTQAMPDDERAANGNPHEWSGRAAFRAGKPRVLPPEYVVAIGSNPENARAWYRGWDAANIAAPVELAAAPDGPARQPAGEQGDEPAGLVTIPADPEGVAAALEAAAADESEDPRVAALFGAPNWKPATNNGTTGSPFTPSQVAEQRKRLEKLADKQAKNGVNSLWTVISLFDASGAWSEPWRRAGYNVVRYDLQDGEDIAEFNAEMLLDRHGNDDVWAVLAAPPCTDFASSGAQFWKEKDADGRTAASTELVRQVFRTVELLRPAVWALENPVGRLAKLTGLPKPLLTFQPNAYGDPYTKKTQLWGNFNPDLMQSRVEPTEGSKITEKLSSSAKYERSRTPEGFSWRFFQANAAVKLDADSGVGMAPAQALSQEFHGIEPDAFARALYGDPPYVGRKQATPEQLRGMIADDYYDGDLDAARATLAEQAKDDRSPAPPAPAIRSELDALEDEADALVDQLTDEQIAEAARLLDIDARTTPARRTFLRMRVARDPRATLDAMKKAQATRPTPTPRRFAESKQIELRRQQSVLVRLLECLG